MTKIAVTATASILATGFLLAGSMAIAADTKPAVMAMDKNADGKVSREEFMQAQSEQFRQKDKNGDGYLELPEVGIPAAHPQAHAGYGHRLLQFDKNGDNKVSREEYLESRQQIFGKLDSNGSGFIEPQEAGPYRSE